MTEKHSLLALRVETGLEQDELAQAAGIARPTISVMERQKQRFRRATAYKVYYALMRERKKRGLPEVRFDEIDWWLVD